MRRLALAVALVFAVGCGEEDQQEQRFVAELRPLNGSSVSGEAELTVSGDDLIVDIEASGLEENRVHDLYIHGFPSERAGRGARCPAGAGARDDPLRHDDVERRYGDAIFALQPFPTVREDGRMDYELRMAVDPDRELEPLEDRVIDIHGMSADLDEEGEARYVPSLPVACGNLRRVDDG